jgi:hypothetical protein
MPSCHMTYPSSSVTFLPVFIARDNGFFERNGLEGETLLLTSDRAMAAVASGEIHYVAEFGSGQSPGAYDELVPIYQGKGLVTREGIENILQAVRDAGRIGPQVRYEDVADGRLAEEVARELGLIP